MNVSAYPLGSCYSFVLIVISQKYNGDKNEKEIQKTTNEQESLS